MGSLSTTPCVGHATVGRGGNRHKAVLAAIAARTHDEGMTSRRIVFAVFPGFQLLDLAGPNEVFVQAGRLTAKAAGAAGQGVVVDTVAAALGPVASSGGITVTPTLTAGEVTGPVDTLVAVGGRGVHQACQDAGFVEWFARTSRRARRTPAAYVESARVEAARRLLESTGTTVEAVARACGYGTRETLQRSFKRAVHVTPGEYRRRFAPHSAAD
jgi:transcriptional regulator GlxA family with amidase domain